MKYVVCAVYDGSWCGSVIELASFDSRQEAIDFTNKPFVLEYYDGSGEDVYYPCDMWIETRREESDLPFCESYEFPESDLPY